MKRYFFGFCFVLFTGLFFVSTLGSSFQGSSTLEIKIKPVRFDLPESNFDYVLPTHYGPPDFPEGQLTASGKPVGFDFEHRHGQVAVSQNVLWQALPMGSTFKVLNVKEFKDIVFEVTDTGRKVGYGQFDFWFDPEKNKKLIKALGDEPIIIEVLSKGSP